jgi:hypothetical protein
MALALIAMVGCSSHHDAPGPAPAPDAAPAATGPFTVNVTKTGHGIVVSDPPGIMCGSCDDPHVTCPLPDPTQPATECSHAFDAGTSVNLIIIAQELYGTYSCMYSPAAASPGAGSDGPCTFTVSQDMDVNITGVEAFQ